MEWCSATIRLALINLMAAISIGSLVGCSAPPVAETNISPISLSANATGLEISSQLLERLVVRTELSHSDLEGFGLRLGSKLDDKEVRKLLDRDHEFLISPYVEYFDVRLGKSGEQAESKVWQQIAGTEGFIKDAILLGGFDKKKQESLHKSLKAAAEKGDDPTQIQARGTAYRLLLEARQGAVRKARGYRQFVDVMKLELDKREFEGNIGMVVDIRKSGKRPTISPLSRVTMRCDKEPDVGSIWDLVFHERKRKCDDFGVCRIESIVFLDQPNNKKLFNKLSSYDGRLFLDGCTITTRMLIDGAEVVRELPGKFTSRTPLGSQ